MGHIKFHCDIQEGKGSQVLGGAGTNLSGHMATGLVDEKKIDTAKEMKLEWACILKCIYIYKYIYIYMYVKHDIYI